MNANPRLTALPTAGKAIKVGTGPEEKRTPPQHEQHKLAWRLKKPLVKAEGDAHGKRNS